MHNKIQNDVYSRSYFARSLGKSDIPQGSCLYDKSIESLIEIKWNLFSNKYDWLKRRAHSAHMQ